MENTGFEKIAATGPGKSREPVFYLGQLYGFFDTVTVGGSLLMECNKPLGFSVE